MTTRADARREGRRYRLYALPRCLPMTRCLLMTGLLAAGFLLLGASPALAHGTGHGSAVAAAGPGWVAVLLRCVVLTGSAVVAGVALLRPLTGPLGQRASLTVLGAALLSAAGLAMAVATAGTGMLWALLQGTATLLVPTMLRRPVPSTVAGVLLTATLAWEATLDHPGMAALPGLAHTTAAVVWLAAATVVATAEPDRRRPLLRRLTPVAVGSAALLAGTGLLQAWEAQLRPDTTSAGSAFGRMVAFEAVLFVAIVVGGVLVLRRTTDARLPRAPVTALAGGLAAAFVAGASLAALDPPVAAAEAGRPVLREVTVAGEQLRLIVVAHRPGPNLVHLSRDGYLVGTGPDRLVPASRRPGAAGGWAVVDLPAGRSQLWVSNRTDRVPVRIEARDAAAPLPAVTGPDGPECLTAVLGGVTGGAAATPRCPSEQLTVVDAATVRRMVRFLAHRGIPGVHLVSDGSPRSIAATEVATRAAAESGTDVAGAPGPGSAVLLLSGWEQAARTLAEQARGVTAGSGTFLAPWLATGPLLGHGTGAVTGLDFDPGGRTAQRYLAALRSRGLTALASPAGLSAWLAAQDRSAADEETRLYASAQVSFLPAELGHAHGGQDRWVPGGTLTPVTGPLRGS